MPIFIFRRRKKIFFLYKFDYFKYLRDKTQINLLAKFASLDYMTNNIII